MPELIDGGTQGVSRRLVLRGVGVLVPGVILAAAGGGVAAAASAPPVDGAVQGRFSAPGYSWPTVASPGQGAAVVSGVAFALTVAGRPLADRQRVRFSISSFHEVANSVWFEASPGRKSVNRLGYLDLDTDQSGTVVLDQWLRRGAVSTAAIGARPMLRAQLVGSETILASVRLSTI